jgi:hypothetical protein
MLYSASEMRDFIGLAQQTHMLEAGNMAFDEERLLVLVLQYPCLFNVCDKGYKDNVRAENAWDEIDQRIGKSGRGW